MGDWKLIQALAKLADKHHRTLEGSKLHDPEHLEWWECKCLTCKYVRDILIDYGYDPKNIA